MTDVDVACNLAALLHSPDDTLSSRSSVAETSDSGLTDINQLLHTIQSKTTHAQVNNDHLRLRADSWNLAELELQKQRAALQHALVLAKHKYEQDLAEVKMDYERRFQRNLKATEEMQAVKEHLHDLSISDAHYAECKRLPDSDLSVREFVLIRVFELRDGFKKQIEQLQLAQDGVRTELAEAKHQQERHSITAAQKSNALAGIQDDFRMLKDESERRIAHLTQEVSKRETEAAASCDKVQKYDDVSAEVHRLRGTVENLQRLTEEQSKQIIQLGREKIDLAERVTQLDMRKGFLEKETADQLAQLQEADAVNVKHSREIAELELKVGRAKEKKRAMQAKMELEQTSTACDVRDRVNIEIQRLEEQMRRDTDLQRQSLLMLHEKESQMLQSQVRDLERQRAEAHRRLEESEHARENGSEMSTKVQMELQQEITELRGLLKLRGFENDRFSLSYEETSGLLAKVSGEKEQLQAKVELLRKEYYELEVRLKDESAQDRATKLALQDQLESYQQMENELDRALEDVGNDQMQVEHASDSLILGTTLAGTPSLTRRRVQESLILAQQLQRKTRALGEAHRTVQSMQEQICALEDEKTLLEKEKKWQSEPTHYLTESLRGRECELADLRRAHTVLKREFDRLAEYSREMEHARKEVEDDLRIMLAQREEVNALQTVEPRVANAQFKTVRPQTRTVLTSTKPSSPQWSKKLKVKCAS